MFAFFFFQAEDGIRDLTVTGVQTCALPISVSLRQAWQTWRMRISGQQRWRASRTARGAAYGGWVLAEIGRGAGRGRGEISVGGGSFKKKKKINEFIRARDVIK